MKAAAVCLAAIVFASVAVQGQGTFLFNTHDLSAGNDVQFEPICYAGQIAPDYFIEVLAGPDVTSLVLLSPALPLSLTGAGAGYPTPSAQIYTVPNMLPGMVATVAYQVHAVNMVSGFHVAQNPVVLTEPPQIPNEVLLGNRTVYIYYCPEPSTWTFALLGLGGVFFTLTRQAHTPERQGKVQCVPLTHLARNLATTPVPGHKLVRSEKPHSSRSNTQFA